MHADWDEYAARLKRHMITTASTLFTTELDDVRVWNVQFAIVNLHDDLEVMREINMARHDLWQDQIMDELVARPCMTTVEETWPSVYTCNLWMLTLPPFAACCTRTFDADGPTPLLLALQERVRQFNASVGRWFDAPV